MGGHYGRFCFWRGSTPHGHRAAGSHGPDARLACTAAVSPDQASGSSRRSPCTSIPVPQLDVAELRRLLLHCRSGKSLLSAGRPLPLKFHCSTAVPGALSLSTTVVDDVQEQLAVAILDAPHAGGANTLRGIAAPTWHRFAQGSPHATAPLATKVQGRRLSVIRSASALSSTVTPCSANAPVIAMTSTGGLRSFSPASPPDVFRMHQTPHRTNVSAQPPRPADNLRHDSTARLRAAPLRYWPPGAALRTVTCARTGGASHRSGWARPPDGTGRAAHRGTPRVAVRIRASPARPPHAWCRRGRRRGTAGWW